MKPTYAKSKAFVCWWTIRFNNHKTCIVRKTLSKYSGATFLVCWQSMPRVLAIVVLLVGVWYTLIKTANVLRQHRHALGIHCVLFKEANLYRYDGQTHQLMPFHSNRALMSLAQSSKLFVSELGTHWGDAVLAFRLRNGLANAVLVPLRSFSSADRPCSPLGQM